ncbi:MAG: hypothetical protein RLZZ153_218 [Pseudomonadota bacterium]|jgi:hypothetical protein
MFKGLLITFLLLLAGPVRSEDGKELIELLQKGGYTIFFGTASPTAPIRTR